jgi:hypothetical protein
MAEAVLFSPLNLTAHRLRLLSAHVAEFFNKSFTQVVVDPAAPSRFEEIRKRIVELGVLGQNSAVNVGTRKWVLPCAAEGLVRTLTPSEVAW